jgi:hypothetical protein
VGAGAPRAYFATVIGRLLEDFARHHFGRGGRIPTWVSRLGLLWERVYRLLCLERQPPAAVVEILRAEAPGGRDEGLIREAIRVIRARVPGCGSPGLPLQVPAVAADAAAAGHAAVEDPGLSPLADRVLIEGAIDADPADPPTNALADPLAEALRRSAGALALSAEERLLLRLIYEEGVPVSQAGRMLGLGGNAVHGRLRRLLGRIRAVFDANGLGEHLRELLEGGSESPRAAVGKDSLAPSICSRATSSRFDAARTRAR